MYTRCPHCQTCFRIAEAHLKAAKGKVRCGSCKEIFDATNHLYSNKPEPESESVQLKNNPIISDDKYQHVNLGTPPDRSNTPDQSKFMESGLNEPSRYNNLDDMAPIDIPGQSNFTDSFIKFVNTEYDPKKKIPAPSKPGSSKSAVDPVAPMTKAEKTVMPSQPIATADPTINPVSQAAAEKIVMPPPIAPPVNSATQATAAKKSVIPSQPISTADSTINPANQAAPDKIVLPSQQPAPLAPLTSTAITATHEPPEKQQAPITFESSSAEDSSVNPFVNAFAQQQEFDILVPQAEATSSPLATEIPADIASSVEPIYEDHQDSRTEEIFLPQESIPKDIGEYADIEAVERPTTNQDIQGIGDLYSAANLQVQEPGDDQEQLNRDIEALLSDAMAFDEFDAPEQAQTEQTILDLAQPELSEASLVKSDDVTEYATSFDDINFLEEAEEEPNETLAKFEEELQNIEFSNADASSFSLDNDDALEDLPTNNAISFDDFEVDQAESDVDDDPFLHSGHDDPENIMDDLPSTAKAHSDELPKALRSSFEYLDRPPRPMRLSIALGLGMAALIIVLLGQTVLFRSYQLAHQFPSLGSMLVSICGTIACRYSGSTDVSKIELINRNVRTHPKQKNALLISTAFKNMATFEQPYPIIAVKLSDLSGDVVATRYFLPEEYLEGLYSKFLLMEPGTPVHITLAVLDPGGEAINFEFDFI